MGRDVWLRGLMLVAALGGAAPTVAYTIVFNDGRRFEAVGPPEYRDGRAVFDLPGGSRGFVPEESIDRVATEGANQDRPETSFEWKYRELPSWHEAPELEEPPEHPPLGSIAPGGLTEPSFNRGDIPEKEKRNKAEPPPATEEEAARRLQRAERLHRRLQRQQEKLAREMAELEQELAALRREPDPAPQGQASVGEPLEVLPSAEEQEPAPSEVAAEEDRTFTNEDLESED